MLSFKEHRTLNEANNKSVKIVSKADAMKIKTARDHRGWRSTVKEADVMDWTGKLSDYLGKKVNVPSNAITAWVERKQNKNGVYAVCFCLLDYEATTK